MPYTSAASGKEDVAEKALRIKRGQPYNHFKHRKWHGEERHVLNPEEYR